MHFCYCTGIPIKYWRVRSCLLCGITSQICNIEFYIKHRVFNPMYIYPNCKLNLQSSMKNYCFKTENWYLVLLASSSVSNRERRGKVMPQIFDPLRACFDTIKSGWFPVLRRRICGKPYLTNFSIFLRDISGSINFKILS